MDHNYMTIGKRIVEKINQGIYSEEDRFPSEFELAEHFETEIFIIRQALQLLIEDEVLIKKHGVGLFVNPKPLFIAGIEELTSVSTMIRQAGMDPGTIFIDFSESEAHEEEAILFNCAINEKILTIKRVRTANNQPVVYCIDRVLRKHVSVDAEEVLSSSIFEAIEQSKDIFIERAIAEIEPVAYDMESSSILRCGIDVSLLALKQKHYSSEGEMVLFSKNFFRADKFSFHVNRKRI